MIRPLAALALMAVAVAWTYGAVRGFAFLNWDDAAVVVENAALGGPDVLRWAFTTTYMEHYQPLAWLAWASIRAVFGLNPAAFHAANLVAHLASVWLVWAVARAVFRSPGAAARSAPTEALALAAALVYGLHPLRVEVVAWISALPYALALALVALSLLAWLRASDRPSRRWRVAALALYAASLAARPVALGYPVVLVATDVWRSRLLPRDAVRRAWPFAVLAFAAAVVESVARQPALNDVPWLYRLQSAATAPFLYIWRTVAPFALSPLDLLPANAAAGPGILLAALLALAGVSGAVWHWRQKWPGVAAAWVAYLALLAPAAGLVPSGLQASADRYTYLPGVVLAFVAAGAGTSWAAGRVHRTRAVAAVLLMVALASAAVSRQGLRHWADSLTLWSRVVSLHPSHEVGLYNLGAALADVNRNDEAAARYREVLALAPEHAGARANLDRLDALRLEREGNQLAAGGQLAEAVERYRLATVLDPRRTHAYAARGMALAQLGRVQEALPALHEAWRQRDGDPAVPNALAAVLLEAGRTADARMVLEEALALHPGNVELSHNLARLLTDRAESSAADLARALTLATSVAEATGRRDPRALATLAAALAANGRRDEASVVNRRAAALAAEQGEAELAVQITARGRAYRSPGP